MLLEGVIGNQLTAGVIFCVVAAAVIPLPELDLFECILLDKSLEDTESGPDRFDVFCAFEEGDPAEKILKGTFLLDAEVLPGNGIDTQFIAYLAEGYSRVVLTFVFEEVLVVGRGDHVPDLLDGHHDPLLLKHGLLAEHDSVQIVGDILLHLAHLEESISSKFHQKTESTITFLSAPEKDVLQPSTYCIRNALEVLEQSVYLVFGDLRVAPRLNYLFPDIELEDLLFQGLLLLSKDLIFLFVVLFKVLKVLLLGLPLGLQLGIFVPFVAKELELLPYAFVL